MSKPTVDDLVLEYLQGTLPEIRRQKIKTELLKMGYKTEDLEQLKYINTQLDKIPDPEPGEMLSKNFHSMLAPQNQEKKIKTNYKQALSEWIQKLRSQKFMLQPAFGILLFSIGLISGYLISNSPGYDRQLNSMAAEIQEMKTMVTLSMLNQDSPSNRMRTINSIQSEELQNGQIINALLTTLNDDPNVNVRLSALYLLDQMTDDPMICQGLIHSIQLQDSPLLQIAMIDILVSLEEGETRNILKDLALRKKLHYSVRTKINRILKVLI